MRALCAIAMGDRMTSREPAKDDHSLQPTTTTRSDFATKRHTGPRPHGTAQDHATPHHTTAYQSIPQHTTPQCRCQNKEPIGVGMWCLSAVVTQVSQQTYPIAVGPDAQVESP